MNNEYSMTGQSGSLDNLLEGARNLKMFLKEMEEQRRSFAYGNSRLHNPNITRADIDKVADKLYGRTN